MRVLICGSRGWHDPRPIDTLLAGLDVMSEGASQGLVVIHGDAQGADRLAGRLAKDWGAHVIAVPAEWDKYGKAAGPIRNQKMLDEYKPDVVYAFRSYGKSNGTDHMVAIARKSGIPTYVVNGEVADEQED